MKLWKIFMFYDESMICGKKINIFLLVINLVTSRKETFVENALIRI